MTDPTTLGRHLQVELETLAPLDFVALAPPGRLLHMVELTRREDAKLEVRTPGRPRGMPELSLLERSALHERGFASADPADPQEPWCHEAADAAAAVALGLRVLREVFQEKPDVALDVIHGSHRAEHEARRRLQAVRERIEQVIGPLSSGRIERDEDGDYLLPVADVRIVIAPRVAPGGPAVVRVFAITSVGVPVTGELGLFLARLNFGLMFGRFALDAEHQSIWFDETLLGDQFNDDELRFTIQAVASTADLWDDRLKQMFGGVTYQEVLSGRAGHAAPPIKPGQGGYL